MGIIRNENHIICEQAETFFKQLLPKEWIVRSQRPDYALDFEVELSKKDEKGKNVVSGLAFHVQLKGRKKVSYTKKGIAYSISKKDLRYFLERRTPVFLIVVDVVNKKAYWAFVQKQIINDLSKIKKSNKSRVIQIPFSNSLDDHSAIERAVREADLEMAAIRPGASELAIKAECTRLELADPRIVAKPKTIIEVSSSEPLRGNMHFEGNPNKIQDLLNKAIDYGEKISPREEGIRAFATGLPGLGSDAEVGSFQISKKIAGSCRMYVEASDGSERGSVELSGYFAGGNKKIEMSVEVPSKVFKINIIIGEQEDKGIPVAIKYHADTSPWVNVDVRFLPDFDRLLRLFGDLGEGDSVKIELFLAGNTIGVQAVPRNLLVGLEGFSDALKIIRKLRNISNKTNAKLQWPHSFGIQDSVWIDLSDRLLSGEIVELPISGGEFQCQYPAGALREKISGPVPIAFQLPSFNVVIFGVSLVLGQALVSTPQGEIELLSEEVDAIHEVVRATCRFTKIAPISATLIQKVL